MQTQFSVIFNLEIMQIHSYWHLAGGREWGGRGSSEEMPDKLENREGKHQDKCLWSVSSAGDHDSMIDKWSHLKIWFGNLGDWFNF